MSPSAPSPGPRPLDSLPTRVLAYAVAFVLAVALARMLVIPQSGLALIWPAAGVATLWALRARTRTELACLVVTVLVVITPWYLSAGFAPVAALLVSVANLVTAFVTVGVATRTGRRPLREITTSREAYRFMVSAFVAVLAATAVGMAAIRVDGGTVGLDAAVTWAFRYLAGIALVTGCGLAFAGWRQVRSWPRWTEVAGLLVATVVAGAVVVAVAPHLTVGYGVLLVLFWSATRMPVPLAGAHAALLSLGMVVVVPLLGRDVFGVGDDGVATATSLQVFVTVSCGLGVVVASAMNERTRLVADLTRARDRAQRLVTDAPQGIAVLDSEGRVVQANAALARMVGRTAWETTGTLLESYSPGHEDVLRTHLETVRAHPERRHSTDWTLGPETHVVLSSRLLDADTTDDERVLVHVVDVSERRRFEQQLSYLADHDVLTGLANRRRFDAELESVLSTPAGDRRDGGLLLLDLDHFKEVNDTIGHHAGDDLLVGVAGVLRSSLRSTDVVARLGGDEFAAIIPGVDRARLARIAHDVGARIRDHARGRPGAARHVTASIGAVTFSGAAQQGIEPLLLADMLMYDAKEAGRDGVAVHDPAVGHRPRSGPRMEWKVRLEKALAEDSFVLHLQPILDLATDTVTGAEALIRLADADELDGPADFIPVAESTGLASALDEWVIRHGVAMLAELPPGFRLSLNISGQSIGKDRFRDALLEAVAEHGVDASSLVLEITETAAVADFIAAREFAQTISATGARFALDDFGAGFGSFSYLKTMDFDVVKIDGEFVAHLDSSSVDRSIVRSIVGVAHELDKRVVAEFVGTPAVLEAVRAEGIDFAQGYEIGRPVPLEEFRALHLEGEDR